jgi:hypothetical protein
MAIRWVPSVVHLVACYANLMLPSSFLGLEVGAMAAARRWNLIGWFPVFPACDIAMLLMDRKTVIVAYPGSLLVVTAGRTLMPGCRGPWSPAGRSPR